MGDLLIHSCSEELISVIVPVFNVGDYLVQCIDSILNQEFKNIEIILIDDGSTDKSGEICDNYAAAYDNVLVRHQGNSGVSVARNYGIDHAHGEWLIFVDGDDIVSPKYISTLRESISRSGADIAMCKGRVFFNEPDIHFSTSKTLICNRNDAIAELLSERLASTAPWGKLAKTKLWRECHFPMDRKFEDLAITWKLLDRSDSVSIFCGDIYFYRKHKNSISSSSDVKTIIDYYVSINQLWKECPSSSKKLSRAKAFRCCLECCRLLSVISILRNEDGGREHNEHIRNIKQESIKFLRANAAKAIQNRYASYVQRVRIFLTALFPIVATLIR